MSQTFPKYDRFKELQVIFKDLQPVPHQPKVTTIVIRDSVIKNVNGRDVSRGDSVEIRLGGGGGGGRGGEGEGGGGGGGGGQEKIHWKSPLGKLPFKNSPSQKNVPEKKTTRKKLPKT